MAKGHTRLDRQTWERARRAALVRDDYRCAACSKRGLLEVDHRVPLKRGGDPYSLDNLQSLCRSCHFAKTASENRSPRSTRQAAWDAYVSEIGR